jgi:hypothetical protein
MYLKVRGKEKKKKWVQGASNFRLKICPKLMSGWLFEEKGK